MSNKITIPLLVIISGLAVFLVFQNIKLNEQLKEFSKKKEEVKITPVDPAALSPFDQAHTDPMGANASATSTEQMNPTTIGFDKMIHDFGKISEGEKVKTTFTFTNTGDKPLVITNAQGSCGCTVPDWPKEPVKPGEKGKIDVEFDSKGKNGQNEKTVTVTANTEPAATTLIIKSTVVPKDK